MTNDSHIISYRGREESSKMINQDSSNNKEESEYGSSNEECSSSLEPTSTEQCCSLNNPENNTSATGSTPSNDICSDQTYHSGCVKPSKTSLSSAQVNIDNSHINLKAMFNNHSRILGRNLNGTIAMTTQPSNESELQLYRVLQRANLLAYYDTFICQGGDDVQQLYEAGEEEFLEIMALVGMAAKPLHVRRLQKALHEWATNPSLFQSPLVPPFTTQGTGSSGSNGGGGAGSSSTNSVAGVGATNGGTASTTLATTSTPSSSSTTTRQTSQQQNNSPRNHNNNSPGLIFSNAANNSNTTGNHSSNTPSTSPFQHASSNLSEYSQPCSPSSMTPILMEQQIHRLAEAADSLVKVLPPSLLELKPPSGNNNNGNKKRIVKEIENIMNMADDDPRRMDEIRKYAAIYGRFDCKRKPEKPLTLHEVSVNEASAQICSKVPSLLYRREKLFPLARQVVRDSGYQYSKGHSRSQSCRIGGLIADVADHHSGDSSSGGTSAAKRIRLGVSSPSQESSKTGSAVQEEDRKRRHNRLEGIVDQLKSLGSKQEEIKSQIKDANERQNFQEVSQLQNELDLINNHHMQLVNEKSELEQEQQRHQQQQQQTPQQTQQQDNKSNNRKMDPNGDKTDTDADTDSQFSLYSNESTPSLLQDSHSSPSINADSSVVAGSINTGENASNKSSKKNKNVNQTTIGSGYNDNNGLSIGSSISNINTNSNDSIDFSKQLMNEVIDEGLRLMGHVIEDNLDLRLFNKYTEALRSNNETPNSLSNNGAGNGSNSFRSSSQKNPDTSGASLTPHRQRGRPPKSITSSAVPSNASSNSNNSSNTMSERDLPSTFYEQLLSQAQIQQQMQLYQSQLYAQALFGDVTAAAAVAGLQQASTSSGTESTPTPFNIGTADAFLNSKDVDSSINNNGTHHSLGSDTSNGNLDRDEVVQSLNALISMSNRPPPPVPPLPVPDQSSSTSSTTSPSALSLVKSDHLSSSVEFKI